MLTRCLLLQFTIGMQCLISPEAALVCEALCSILSSQPCMSPLLRPLTGLCALGDTSSARCTCCYVAPPCKWLQPAECAALLCTNYVQQAALHAASSLPPVCCAFATPRAAGHSSVLCSCRATYMRLTVEPCCRTCSGRWNCRTTLLRCWRLRAMFATFSWMTRLRMRCVPHIQLHVCKGQRTTYVQQPYLDQCTQGNRQDRLLIAKK